MLLLAENNLNGLSGAILILFIVSTPIAWLASNFLVARYRKALIKGMGYDSDTYTNHLHNDGGAIPIDRQVEIEVIDTSNLSKSSSTEYLKVSETLGWHWIIYGLMCLAFAWWCAHFYLFQLGEVSFLGRLLVIFAMGFPFVIISFFLLVSSRRQFLIMTGLVSFTIILILYILFGLNNNDSVNFSGLIITLISLNCLPLLIILLLRVKKIRTVGFAVLAFVLMAMGGPILFFWYLANNSKALEFFAKPLTEVGFSSVTSLLILFIVSLLLAAFLGWCFLKWLKNLYQRKQINDLQLTADAIVIVFNLLYSLFIIEVYPKGALLMLLAFPLYKAVGYILFLLLRRRRVNNFSPRLLLLRVFALGDDADSLFQRVLTHWRYAGSIQVISGPDLALSTLELHEMINFVTGNMKQSFCEDEASIERNINQLENTSDLDSTHRVNEFFCRNNNWKEVLQQLVKRSEVVLMDLRSFTEKYTGCRFEIEALVNLFPMSRTVILVDKRTDLEFTKKVFNEAYAKAASDSINVIEKIPVKLFMTSKTTDDEVFRINNLMCSITESLK